MVTLYEVLACLALACLGCIAAGVGAVLAEPPIIVSGAVLAVVPIVVLLLTICT